MVIVYRTNLGYYYIPGRAPKMSRLYKVKTPNVTSYMRWM